MIATPLPLPLKPSTALPQTTLHAMATVWGNAGQTLLQANDGFKLMAATMASLLMVASRCVVATQSAQQAKGTPQQDSTQTAQAQTFFREWGAFVASYGVVKVLAAGLSCTNAHVFNAQLVKADHVGLGKALGQTWGLLTGQLAPQSIPPIKGAVSALTEWQPKAEGLRNTGVLHALAQHLPQVKQHPSLPHAEQHLLALQAWQHYMPTAVASLVGVVLSGWCLERVALANGPKIVAALKQGMSTNPQQPQPIDTKLPAPTLLAASGAVFQPQAPSPSNLTPPKPALTQPAASRYSNPVPPLRPF
jgi:hypothetical protein